MVDERSRLIGSVQRWRSDRTVARYEAVDVKPRHGRRGSLLHFHETMIQQITAVTVTIDRQVASDRGPAEAKTTSRTQGMATVRIDLEAGDVVLLRDVLAAVVRDMSPEIADTDNAAYRRDLKARRIGCSTCSSCWAEHSVPGVAPLCVYTNSCSMHTSQTLTSIS